MSTSRTGDIAELRAVAWLLDQGYEVFRNVGSTGPADLVVWEPGEQPFLVDVKYRKHDNGKPHRTSPSAQTNEHPQVRYLFALGDGSFMWQSDCLRLFKAFYEEKNDVN